MGRIAGVGLVMALDGLAAAGGIVLLGQRLPAKIFGQVHFVLAVVPIVGTIALLGQREAVARFLPAAERPLAWRPYVQSVIWRTAVATAVIGAGLYFFVKDTTPLVFAVTMATAFCYAVREFFAAGILRGFGRVREATLLLSLSGILLLVGTLLVRPETSAGVLGVILATFALPALASVSFAFAAIPSGDGAIDPAIWRDGAWLWTTTIYLVLVRNLDSVIMATVISPESLASYGALLTVMGGFPLLGYAANFLLLPRFAAAKHPTLRKTTLDMLVLAAGLAVGYLFLARPALHLLFQGRYDAASPLAPILVVAGVLAMAQSVPTTMVSSRLKGAPLRTFAIGNLLLIAPILGGSWGLAHVAGVVGVAWGRVGTNAIRLMYASLFASHYALDNPAAEGAAKTASEPVAVTEPQSEA